jgi:regulator of sigma E protease
VNDWTEWVGIVRAHPERALELEVERSGQVLEMTLVPEARQERGETIGQIGVYPFVDESAIESMRVVVRYGLVEALGQAGLKTWDMSALTLRVLWKLVLGEASLRNISGPISIAEYAGISAVIGLSAFLAFLSIVSISLGILNLLPVPVLDGGHLLYYVIELVKGSPVSEKTEAFGQRIGVAMLAALMALAFYNDLTRLFG